MNKDIKADALMLAARMRELAEDIEYEVGKMGENAAVEWSGLGFPDFHRAEAKRLSLTLWRLSARFRRVLYGKEKV